MTDALVIQDLRKVYASGVEALRGIDLTVEEGDFYALWDRMAQENQRRLGL